MQNRRKDRSGLQAEQPQGSWRESEYCGRIRELILQYGWNATAYQLINPGVNHWFAGAGDALVGYIDCGGVRVVAGAPVCAKERLPAVVQEFEDAAIADRKKVCYFAAEARLEGVCAGWNTHCRVLLGAQPSWHPSSWDAMLAGHASLRAQLNRSRNKGVRVEEWSEQRATRHPELEACLASWLARRGLPAMHFLVEPMTLDCLFDRRVFVATRKERVVAYLVASPISSRKGWLIEQIVRGGDCPNGTAELLVDAAIRAVTGASEYVSLGLSPLSPHLDAGTAPCNPAWLRVLFAWARAHGRRFYNFEGLDAFKSKFRPERWEPVYAITNQPRFTLQALYAIAAAFTNGRPVLSVLGGLGRAARREMDWLAGRLGSARERGVASTPTIPT